MTFCLIPLQWIFVSSGLKCKLYQWLTYGLCITGFWQIILTSTSQHYIFPHFTPTNSCFLEFVNLASVLGCFPFAQNALYLDVCMAHFLLCVSSHCCLSERILYTKPIFNGNTFTENAAAVGSNHIFSYFRNVQLWWIVSFICKITC